MKNVDEYIGLTLKEVKEKHNDVRVMGVGDIGFMGTADFEPGRLNVRLSSEGFTIKKVVKVYAGVECEFDKIEETNYDHGKIVSAWFG